MKSSEYPKHLLSERTEMTVPLYTGKLKRERKHTLIFHFRSILYITPTNIPDSETGLNSSKVKTLFPDWVLSIRTKLSVLFF